MAEIRPFKENPRWLKKMKTVLDSAEQVQPMLENMFCQFPARLLLSGVGVGIENKAKSVSIARQFPTRTELGYKLIN